jgi:hypothetical protein
MGRDRSVDIVTHAGLDGPGIKSQCGQDVPHPAGPRAHAHSCTMGTGSFLGVKWPGHGARHPTPHSITKANKRVYLYSPLGLNGLYSDSFQYNVPPVFTFKNCSFYPVSMIPTTNHYHFSEHSEPIGLCNGHAVCFLSDRKTIFMYHSDEFRTSTIYNCLLHYCHIFFFHILHPSKHLQTPS